MRNVTLAIEEEVLQRARIRALKEGTSVNELIRKYLADYGGQEERLRNAMDRVLESAERYRARAASDRGRAGTKRTWSREETHERGPGRGR
jgi:hypothetical protein